jgi:hypothetical protein|tara:strand:+ start:379 stop:798 length:420 start_codon:yes stop_codon:yes gene_type:complete
MYKPDNFIIQELVDPELYEMFKDNEDVMWRMFDEEALRGLQWLRDRFGSATVNSWERGGDRKWSGMRTTKSPYYSQGSMHSCGKAFDIIFDNYTAEEVREELKLLGNTPHITRYEDDVSWTHMDTKPTNTPDKDYYFKV